MNSGSLSIRRVGYNQYRKSYDPYDSHDENEDECPDCDKHAGSPFHGKHSDCCPRYVDSSALVDKFYSNDENESVEISSNIVLPKQRKIQPITSNEVLQSDDLYLEQFDASGERDDYANVIDDGICDSDLSMMQSKSKKRLHGPTRAKSMRGLYICKFIVRNSKLSNSTVVERTVVLNSIGKKKSCVL